MCKIFIKNYQKCSFQQNVHTIHLCFFLTLFPAQMLTTESMATFFITYLTGNTIVLFYKHVIFCFNKSKQSKFIYFK